MRHFELVQTATDLLAEARDPGPWLDRYDAALASNSDELLTALVAQLRHTARTLSSRAA